jgi:hypothetical protein
MNQDKKKNEKVIAKFEIAELTNEELRTIEGRNAGDVVDKSIYPEKR